MSDIKQTNFRIDADSADAFRQFCDEQGYNQAQGFDHLLQVLELNRAKSAIEGRLTEITTFEEYMKKIMDAYLNSLQIAQNTEERVREDFRSDIGLRDRAIAEAERKLIEKDEELSQIKEAFEKATKAEKEAIQTAENTSRQAESAKQVAEETRKVSDMLSSKLVAAEEKLDAYDKLKVSEENLNSKLADAMLNMEELKRNLISQKKESEHEKEMAVLLAVSKAEKDMQEQLAALHDETVRQQTIISMLKEQIQKTQTQEKEM